MHVVETLVAKFPNYDQNHGIRRVIPVTNQAGKNVVISNPSKFTANITAVEKSVVNQTQFLDDVTIDFLPLRRVENRHALLL